MSNSENNKNGTTAPERKKISLQEAMKQQISAKNKGFDFGKPGNSSIKGNQNTQSQQAKKRTNQRSRRGV